MSLTVLRGGDLVVYKSRALAFFIRLVLSKGKTKEVYSYIK